MLVESWAGRGLEPCGEREWILRGGWNGQMVHGVRPSPYQREPVHRAWVGPSRRRSGRLVCGGIHRRLQKHLRRLGEPLEEET
jgi:hypothetical protein